MGLCGLGDPVVKGKGIYGKVLGVSCSTCLGDWDMVTQRMLFLPGL